MDQMMCSAQCALACAYSKPHLPNIVHDIHFDLNYFECSSGHARLSSKFMIVEQERIIMLEQSRAKDFPINWASSMSRLDGSTNQMERLIRRTSFNLSDQILNSLQSSLRNRFVQKKICLKDSVTIQRFAINFEQKGISGRDFFLESFVEESTGISQSQPM